ncbi:proteasome accessory factor B [Micrococcales bacterium KH10]|nr:proteasome accessory factor B [Micrococcales bacterium KH10]
MAARITPSERLLSLALALLHTTVPMTKRDIRRHVTGYDADVNDNAFDRMFERDKQLLRELGFTLVTIGTDGHGEEIGYRVEVPNETTRLRELTATDITVMGIAANLWRAAAPGRDITTALIKLRALGLGGDTDASMLAAGLLPDSVALSTDNDPAYEAFTEAISTRRAVKFEYRGRFSGELTRRHVQPWRIAVRTSGWYLVGHDVDRDDTRLFHFERIVKKVQLVGPEGAYTIPAAQIIDEAAQSISARTVSVATLIAKQGRAGELRNRATAIAPLDNGRDQLEVEFTHLDVFARQIAGYGDALVVIEPAELRDRVIDLLSQACALGDPETDGKERHG